MQEKFSKKTVQYLIAALRLFVFVIEKQVRRAVCADTPEAIPECVSRKLHAYNHIIYLLYYALSSVRTCILCSS